MFDEEITNEQIKEKVKETLSILQKKDLVSDSDAIKGTQYLMSKFTQSCIYSGFGLDSLVQIMTKCIRLIILYLTRPKESFRIEAYYSDGFDEWISNFEVDKKEKERYAQNRALSRPALRLIQNDIYLRTGKFSMEDTYDPNDVWIVVKSGNNEKMRIHIDDPNAITFDDREDVLGGYIVHSQEIKLNCSPLINLNYSIEVSGKELFNSKERLFKPVLFFDGAGTEIKPGVECNEEIFVITQRNNEFEYGERIHTICGKEDYFISSIEVDSEQVFQFDDESFVFYKIAEPSLIGYKVPWVAVTNFEGKRYDIYKKVIALFQAPCEMEDIIVEIDGIKYQYDSDIGNVYDLKLYSNDYNGNLAYTIELTSIDAGWHNFRIINGITNKQIKNGEFNVVFDPNIEKRYVNNNELSIFYELKSSFCDDVEIEWPYGCPSCELAAFINGIGYGKMEIYPSSISYYLDDEWHELYRSFYLCGTNKAQNQLKVCGPSKMKAYYCFNDRKYEASFKASAENENIYYLDLSYLKGLQAISNMKMCFEFGNIRKYIDVWFNPYIDKEKSSFYYDDDRGEHIFIVVFDGCEKTKISIKKTGTDNIILEKEIRNGEAIVLKDADIPEAVKELSVAAHGVKYSGLFTNYQEEPFFIFSKYTISQSKTKISNWEPKIFIKSDILHATFEFNGSETALMKVTPNGRNWSTPIFSKTIVSGECVDVDLTNCPFKGYRVSLYPSLAVNNIEKYDNEAIFTTKELNKTTEIIKQAFSVKYFIFESGHKVETNYSLFLYSIEELNGDYYAIGRLQRHRDIVKKDLYIKLLSSNRNTWIAEMGEKTKNGIVKQKTRNGEVVKQIVIQKNGR